MPLLLGVFESKTEEVGIEGGSASRIGLYSPRIPELTEPPAAFRPYGDDPCRIID